MKQLLILVFLLAWSAGSGAAALFENNEVIEVSLSGPLNSIFKDSEQREERSFSLGVDGVEIPVQTRLRGNSRVRICKFPPIRLNFRGSDTKQTVFEGQEILKLVTHCRNAKGSDMNVLEEYAAFRIFNLLSDYSYRVRLLHINYEDTERELDKDAKLKYGFVIEPKEQLQARKGGEWAKLAGVKMSRIEENQAALVFVFQYLIGNTDWSFATAEGDEACCHNGGLLEIDSKLYYVPYDFDLAGLVNAKYAKPDASLRIRSVRQRLYRGYCISSEPLRSAIRQVKSKQAEILNVLNELPDYPEKARAKNLKYLNDFFEVAEDEDELVERYEKKCL